MRYKIIDNVTGKCINGSHYFCNKTKAENYLLHSTNNPSNYTIIKVTDLELKSTIKYYDDALIDLYHEFEITKDKEMLLKLCGIMKQVLKDRRKVKNKLKGIRGSILLSDYKYKTTILEDHGFFEEEEIFNV